MTKVEKSRRQLKNDDDDNIFALVFLFPEKK